MSHDGLQFEHGRRLKPLPGARASAKVPLMVPLGAQQRSGLTRETGHRSKPVKAPRVEIGKTQGG